MYAGYFYNLRGYKNGILKLRIAMSIIYGLIMVLASLQRTERDAVELISIVLL
jgi:hypothetical protein